MGKKSILLLQEFEAVFRELETDAERSALILAIFAYAFHGEEPELTGILRYAWRTHIKPKLDEMDANYEKKCNSLRENAKKRWSMQKDANASKRMQTDADAYDKDKDKDKDKDIHNNNYSESNIQPSVDNSVDNSMDGMDFYKLSSKDAFEMFRQKYPRRQGALRDVQTAWVTAIVGNHILPGDLVTAAGRYAEECRENGTEARFIKMPQNFISSGTWKQYAPKYLPSCPRCHGQGTYEQDGGMVMCDCDRRYG